MPIEPLSITASVIGITRLTFDSCKTLNDTIKGIKRAPSKLKDLETSLDAFQKVIKPFEEDLVNREDAALSPDQLANLRALEPVMLYCRDICNKFTKRVSELTSHSDENHMAWRDRLRLNFNDSEIRLLKENLAQCQRTLSDALGFANL
ncbi:hypothetical protein M406DRAFT_331005 [Cryphonectria parasitica EP155]|uniref:Azaphilone pigments biosynthesis cluster protein L N-terminal domain-containing protein n=1 Tax=Cryphonectria parasitica (strain ATCC 38755 / EP155) TaxID=660469 RepID=A0A9P4Y1F9_CRYP1|nr:uncharacterized protein M406DRAFT_331005 [Cryphonectria parasitica EP155]KAF3764680.1 hypothetical protein M406DRAFT_331005 [Cryphonectria parasitica EP155]